MYYSVVQTLEINVQHHHHLLFITLILKPIYNLFHTLLQYTALSLVILSHLNKKCSASSTSPEPHCAQFHHPSATKPIYLAPPSATPSLLQVLGAHSTYNTYSMTTCSVNQFDCLFGSGCSLEMLSLVSTHAWPAPKLCIFDYHESTVVIISPFCSIL